MKVESPVFGALDVSADKILEFPAGLPGFEDCKRFTLVHEEGAKSILMLQSVDDPQIVFSLAGADTLGVNYEFSLTDDEAALIDLGSAEDAAVAVIVHKAPPEASPATAGLQANFMAPIVINTQSRKGLQKVISKLGCDVTLRARE
ncbi:MAG: flagellar assembly protein FliW [Rhodocyclaceae bacterium]|nr:flagellar assembly protein FliW [Rhodocyclaceae bacterium]